mgnify:CR=1 FL=1
MFNLRMFEGLESIGSGYRGTASRNLIEAQDNNQLIRLILRERRLLNRQIVRPNQKRKKLYHLTFS